MVSIEKIEIPITDLMCEGCSQEDQLEVGYLPSPYMVVNMQLAEAEERPVSVSIDVESIEWKKLSAGQYAAQARVRINCPCCESIRSIGYHIRSSRLVLSSVGLCSSCGMKLELEDEEVMYDGLCAEGAVVVIRGVLVCKDCLSERRAKVDVRIPASAVFEETEGLSVDIAPHSTVLNHGRIDEEPRKRHLLVVVANPRDSDTLRLATECRVIDQCIERGAQRDFLEARVIQAATIDYWARAMLDREYNVVHFSGHGTDNGLVLEDDDGEAQIVSAQALGDMLTAYQSVECVIFNACFSAIHIESSLSQVPYVILMKGAISDSSATEFSRGFYDAIGAGKSIEFSFGEGCRRIDLKDLPNLESPRLYIRGGKVTR